MLQILISGAINGLIRALIAFGFQISYSTSKTANFGHGAVVMLGGLVTATVAPKVGYWLALPAAMVVCALAGAVVERVAISPYLKNNSTSWITATVGFGLFLKGLCDYIFGKDEMSVQTPLSEDPISLGSASIMPHEVLAVAVTLAAAIALALFAKSRIGKAMEAVSVNKEAAQLQGIPAGAIVTGSFMASSALAGVAGWVLSPITGAGPSLELLGVLGFSAAVTAGMDSPRGAFFVALGMGVLESLTAYYLPSGFRTFPTLIVCALIIAFRPTGLFGKQRIKKV